MVMREPTAGPPAGPEGRLIDLGPLLRQASTRVRVDQLARQGRQFVALLSRELIDQLINRAVRTILEKHRSGLPGPRRLQEESRREFQELFEQVRDADEARSQLEASRSELDEELEEARQALEQQDREALEREIREGYEAFRKELDVVLGRAFDHRRTLLDGPGSEAAQAELQALEGVLQPPISRLAEMEWRRWAAQGMSKSSALQEKRIRKLNAHVAALESALRSISSSKPYSNQQIQNLLRELGLLETDRYFEKKKEMLQIVLSSNKDLRQRARELEARGITLATPQGRPNGVTPP
jgi:hypothetical protein